jgi:hypothetical protein
LIVTPDQRGLQYPIGDDDSWNCIVQNIGVVVDHLETAFVPEVEGRYPATPAWFQSFDQ